MKKIHKTIGIVFMVLTIHMSAQEYKFGKVSKEELLEKAYPLDSSANAAVLYENKKVSVAYSTDKGFQLITEVFKRVKLYNKDGFEYASEELFLYKNGGNKESVTGLKGATFTLVDGKIRETKLKKDGVFKSEFSEYYNQQKFTMPSIEEGSVIEYKYRVISPFLSIIDRIYLQYKIPIKKMEVKVESPEYYSYKKFSTGYLPINLKETTSNDKITFTNKVRSRPSHGRGGSDSNFYQNTVDFRVNQDNIESINVPAFKEEPYSGNTENYISSLSYELSFVKFPNEAIDYRSTTWEDVTKKIYKSPNFGDELKKTSYYKDDVENLLTGVTNEIEKTSLIYTFVKNKMNWNKKRGVYARKGVKKAYKETTGNTAEINLMLTSMLNYAKIDANPVIASTGDRLISLFPTLNGFNYVLTRVKLADGSVFYLDATDKYGVPNVLPNRIIRGMGRVIAKNGTSQMVTFRPVKPSANIYQMQCQIDDQGVVKGKVSINHRDYLAHNFRVANAAKDDDSRAKRFEKKYGITELDEYTIKGVKEYGKGVNERFSFTIEDQIEAIDDEIFFSPLLFLRDKENVFKSDERQYPIDFGYGFSNKYMINLKIPEGYEVVEYPKTSAFKLPEDMGQFSFRSNVSNGVIQVVVDETIKSPVIPADYYPAIKEFYNQVILKENEQVVLKKI
ncbi:transglutaminase [uncultured Aquimarina sp.]|uniref:transglutaminase n=1 Tax=uncultured Aquimarina sp. TaxID=575652 RepID=UPI00261A723E|nr:transglutaminase [uncultured Aquimarina sp.]